MRHLMISVLILAGMALPASAESPCCTVRGIDARTGMVTAKETATGRTFQFKVTDAVLLKTLHAGSPVYANFKTKQVSVDGASPCCDIESISALPATKIAATGASTQLQQAAPPSDATAAGAKRIAVVPPSQVLGAGKIGNTGNTGDSNSGKINAVIRIGCPKCNDFTNCPRDVIGGVLCGFDGTHCVYATDPKECPKE